MPGLRGVAVRGLWLPGQIYILNFSQKDYAMLVILFCIKRNSLNEPLGIEGTVAL